MNEVKYIYTYAKIDFFNSGKNVKDRFVRLSLGIEVAEDPVQELKSALQ
jgi:O-acetylhomoserine/O-acetylserine sulfhydrylase-like pyridoxal-dependent enzyme